MKMIVDAMRDYLSYALRGWNRFWFTAVDPATLSVIRVCAGLMLFYTHLIWSFDLEAFFGVHGSWLSFRPWVLPPSRKARRLGQLKATEVWNGRL